MKMTSPAVNPDSNGSIDVTSSESTSSRAMTAAVPTQTQHQSLPSIEVEGQQQVPQSVHDHQKREPQLSRSGKSSNSSEDLPEDQIDVVDVEVVHDYWLNPQTPWYSKIFFSWAWPLLQLGKERPLEEEDIPPLNDVDSSNANRDYIMNLLVEHGRRCRTDKGHDKNLLFRSICWDYITTTWFSQVLLVVTMVARIGQAIALGYLLEQFMNHSNRSPTNNYTDYYIWTAVLVVCGAILFPAKQHQFFDTYRKGSQIRTGLVACIFHKSLRLLPSLSSSMANTSTTKGPSPSSTSKSEDQEQAKQHQSSPNQYYHDIVSAGHVTNLASNDVERYIMASVTGIYIFWGPIEAIAIIIIGWKYVIGPAFAFGFVLLLIFVFLQSFWSHQFASLRRNVAIYTDQRVSLVGQLITCIRVIKMNCWETPFTKRITDLRAKEMSQIQLSNKYKSYNEALYYTSSLIVATVVFIIHVHIFNDKLSSRNVFTTITLLNIIQFTMTKIVPTAIMTISESYVSSQRIQAFLQLPELETEIDSEADCHPTAGAQERQHEEGDVVLRLKDVTCYWNATKELAMRGKNGKVSMEEGSSTYPLYLTKALRDVTLDFASNKLYCVIGRVGSGKSALLQALAGELPIAFGEKNLICNTREFKEGHQTSESPSTATIAYAPQDPWIMNGTVRENILLGLEFDKNWYQEVTTACDLANDIEHQWSQYGDKTQLGSRGIQCSGGQRARIGLARALYRRDAQILLLDDPLSAVDTKVGRKIFYSAIQGLGVQRGKCVILATHQHQFIVGTSTECIVMDGGKVASMGPYDTCAKTIKYVSSSSDLSNIESSNHVPADEVKEIIGEGIQETNEASGIGKKGEKDTQKEERNTGIVKLSTWIEYARAMGGISIAFALLMSFTLTQGASLVSIVEIGTWAEVSPSDQKSTAWLAVILGLTGGTVLLAVARALLSFYFCAKASQRLHDSIAASVLFSKISFFDTNPSGRILNRFSADIGIADEQLPLTMYDFLVGCFMALGSIATSIAVLPMILLTVPGIVWYFWRLRGIFVTSTRELKRLEGIARSPIFEMMAEALNGISTIRSNGALGYFREKFQNAHDTHTKAYFAFVATSRMFATRMEFITFFLMSIASIFAVLFHTQGWFDVNPAVLGLALTLLLQLAGTNFPWMVRQSAEVVNQMVSVERVTAFGHLPSEGSQETNFDDKLPAGWPQQSNISVNNLTIRYRPELPPSLKGISFNVGHGERVGIVGRTGSGKSTLMQALFRLLDHDENSKIVIDGVDIDSIGLKKLRSSISVIPQVPVLISGYTVRENLDPFRLCDVKDIRDVLDNVQMLKSIEELPHGIDSMVSQSSNFSVGERQLLCLARAILRQSSILVLDEATANIDSHTEELIKDALQKRFSDATVLVIAHRLDTVIDFDKILVLGDGRVLEYGSPKDLLSNEDGAFASMIAHMGDEAATRLKEKIL